MLDSARDTFIILFFPSLFLFIIIFVGGVSTKLRWKEFKAAWLLCALFLVFMICGALGYIYAPEDMSLFEFYEWIFK